MARCSFYLDKNCYQNVNQRLAALQQNLTEYLGTQVRKMSLINQILVILALSVLLTYQQTISVNVQYKNNYEGYYRELVKWQNLRLIDKLNQNSTYTFHLSPNQFLSLKNDQFFTIYTTSIKQISYQESDVDLISSMGQDQTDFKGETASQPQNNFLQTLIHPFRTPSIDIDLTKYTSPVKDQGKCNSCYAHSAIATVEALLYKKYNQIFDLSQQQIVDCTRNWAPKQHDIYNNRGCVGGWGWVSYEYLKIYGVTYQDDYPYRSNRIGTQLLCRWNFINAKTFRVKNYRHFYNKKKPESQCSRLNDLLVQGKTVAASIWVPKTPAFQFYGSATPQIDVWNLCGPHEDVNHQLELVGSTDQYWKLKNSYGLSWGEKGFLYLDKSQGLNCLNVCLDFSVSTGLVEENVS